MYIYLDENNSVFSTSEEEYENGIFIDAKDFIDLDNVYIYENEILTKYNRPEGVNVVFDFGKKEFIDNSTTKEKQDFWKKKMIETNNQIKDLQEIGLGGGSEESALRAKLEEYKVQYMNAVQDEAIEMDKLKEV